MARPFLFPDPKDRSINAPSIIASAAQVLGTYNQANGEEREKVTDVVKEWFVKEALAQGWASADFHGSECVLVAALALSSAE